MKEKVEKVFGVLRSIPPKNYVSIIMLCYLVINTIAVYITGSPLLNFTEEAVTDAVNIVINTVTIIYVFWENNSFSEAALICDDVYNILKDGKVTKEEMVDFINKHKTDSLPTNDEKSEDTDKDKAEG